MNNTCIDFSKHHPLYNELLVCIISVFVLSILVLCKLLRKKLEKAFKAASSIRSNSTSSNNSVPNVRKEKISIKMTEV
mgnify:FL=1